MSVGDALSKRPDAILERGEGALNRGLELMETYGIPKGILMPLQSTVEEGGGVEATGDIWLKQKSTVKHFFKLASSYVSYSSEISCKLEKNKMKDIKGVKARKKYMPIMLPIREIVVDDDEEEGGDGNGTHRVKKIHFKAYSNLEESFPAEYFNNM
ncbi:hypothetical protein SUGI_0493760 [Cryptomeria japonica]|uniref:uncharacterized protein LOC131045844 n=1 Tax=Cryptomeria japonica TaxID=3369 RepID=UPI002408BE76|nr:uncharacterized protein LOC131045844 [Cryptomeria japonica]GLJ25787.1 hypothetical protein SUGI_0493760 [Cryptomeria japonica]